MTVKEFVLDCIEQARGDDLARAKAAFRNYTPAQMNETYGLSNQTPQQLLDRYEAHNQKCDAARKTVNTLL